jgi:hypothetical protein
MVQNERRSVDTLDYNNKKNNKTVDILFRSGGFCGHAHAGFGTGAASVLDNVTHRNAGFSTGAASVWVNVTDRSSSSELDIPRKCERIVLAEACR